MEIRTMNEKTLRALAEAGAIKSVRIIADGTTIYVEAVATNGTFTAQTVKGKLKTWGSLNSAAKWVRNLGIGQVQLDISRWNPNQKGMRI
jgi:hypothetical protein